MDENDNAPTNVVSFDPKKRTPPEGTTDDIPCDQILQGAIGQLDMVLIIGETKDGTLYVASSSGYKPDLLWMVEEFKRDLYDD